MEQSARPRGAFLPGTSIEIIHPQAPRGSFRAVLIDFDGTLSLIRTGWREVMIPMMVEVLRATPRAEEEGTLRAMVADYVDRLTGKQTIYQMIQLCEEVRKRGGKPTDPVEYKRAYLRRLQGLIAGRKEALREGARDPDDFLVPGGRGFLDRLALRGVPLYLASGTDGTDVVGEARLLQIERYFGDRIYGALDDYTKFSKAILIKDMVRQHGLGPGELLSFGDGFVEIEETKRMGGFAVGVATDEERREGVNEWKRERLLRAGADVIVPDLREADALIHYLFGME